MKRGRTEKDFCVWKMEDIGKNLGICILARDLAFLVAHGSQREGAKRISDLLAFCIPQHTACAWPVFNL